MKHALYQLNFVDYTLHISTKHKSPELDYLTPAEKKLKELKKKAQRNQLEKIICMLKKANKQKGTMYYNAGRKQTNE